MKAILLLLGFCAFTASAQQTQVLDALTQCRYETQTDKRANGTVSSTAKETCVDESSVVIKQLRIGDVIREMQAQPHPVIKQDFMYRGNQCRWFVEAGTAQRDLVQYQGIICQIQPNVWRVIDKF